MLTRERILATGSNPRPEHAQKRDPRLLPRTFLLAPRLLWFWGDGQIEWGSQGCGGRGRSGVSLHQQNHS